VELSADDARAIRMTNLLITPRSGRPTDVTGVVEWFGAMQAQDVASGLWSLGARLPAYTRSSVLADLERRTVLRTWPMRGTIHFVPSRDTHWMLELAARRPLQTVEKRWEQLGLDSATVSTSIELLAAALAGGERLTRTDALAVLTAAGIDTSAQRGYHLLIAASIRGVVCMAPHVGKDPTFVLLDHWAAERRRPDRDEALGILAGRYFASHGPATERDFAGWTGLNLTDARRGIASQDLAKVRVDGVEMLVRPADLNAVTDHDDIAVLPPFDEYLLGYKDRSLMATPAQLAAIVPGNNGVFQPTVVSRGKVIALWKRTTGKSATTVTISPFGRVPRQRVTDAFEAYAGYLEHPVRVRWAQPAVQ
jgi:winged helix DNA-binding protein